MKEKSRALILLAWVHDILIFEGIYVLAAAIQNLQGQEAVRFLLSGLFLLIPVVLSYLVICRCRNLLLFLAFSLAVTWGMQTISQNLITGVLTGFIFLFRIYVRIKQGEIRRKMKELPNEAGANEDKEVWEVPTLLDAPRIPYCLILAIMYLGTISFHRPELLTLMLVLLGAQICTCLAYIYLERLEDFMKQNIRVANLPAGAMKRIGNAILLTGIAGLAIFMLPAAIYHEEPLANLHFEPVNMNGGMAGFYEENAKPDYLMEELMRLKSQAKETPEWLKRASELLGILTLAGLLYAALRLIFKAVRHAMESFSDDGDDEITFLAKDDSPALEKKYRKEAGRRGGFRSPDRKIRRLYKKLIRRTLKEIPHGNETPLELEHKAGLYARKALDTETADPGTGTDADRLHRLYEKARYAQEECTKEDLKSAASILSAFR